MHTCSGFDEINPSGTLNEIVLLEILGEGFDEISCGDVLDCEEGLFFLAEHWWSKILKKYY
jgi:hypothetical protein